MDIALKNRIVGVVVLTALAIVLLPVLLDGDELERERIVNRIPTAPDIDLSQADASRMALRMETIKAESRAKLPKQQPVVSESEDATLDINGLPVSWSLQVGSFGELPNAMKLRDQLRNKGYRSYALTVRTDAGELVRVLVGPMLQRERLTQIQQAIERDFSIQSRIVRYNIDDDVNQLGG